MASPLVHPRSPHPVSHPRGGARARAAARPPAPPPPPLSLVAPGRAPADRVLRRGRWVCVQSGEVIDGTDVAIAGDRIAFVGPDAGHAIGPQTEGTDASGKYLVPGLLDGPL